MRNIIPYHLLSLLLIIFYSCAGSGKKADNVAEIDNIIDIESAIGTGKIHNASEFIESLRYIPLETTKASIMKNISKVIVKNDKIYIADFGYVINIFDMEGRHLNTFDRVGRGPGEYNQLGDFDVGDNGHIYVILPLWGMKIMEYGADLKYIRTINPGKNSDAFNDIFFVKDGLFASNSIFDRSAKLAWIMYDDSVNIKVSYSDSYEIRRQLGQGAYSLHTRRYKQYLFKNDLCIYVPGIDTVFNIDYKNDYSKSARYIIKTGKYHFSEDLEREDPTREPITLNAISLDKLLETETHLFLNFDFRGLAPEPFENERLKKIISSHITTVCAVYNKSTGELSILNQPVPETFGLKNDIDNGMVFWPETVFNNHELMSWYNASNLIMLAEEGKIDRSILGNLTENDNPVIVIAMLK